MRRGFSDKDVDRAQQGALKGRTESLFNTEILRHRSSESVASNAPTAAAEARAIIQIMDKVLEPIVKEALSACKKNMPSSGAQFAGIVSRAVNLRAQRHREQITSNFARNTSVSSAKKADNTKRDPDSLEPGVSTVAAGVLPPLSHEDVQLIIQGTSRAWSVFIEDINPVQRSARPSVRERSRKTTTVPKPSFGGPPPSPPQARARRLPVGTQLACAFTSMQLSKITHFAMTIGVTDVTLRSREWYQRT